MATISAIRDAVQESMSAVSGIHRYDEGTGKERLPAAVCFPSTARRVTNKSTQMELTFVIEIHVGLGQGLPRAQDELDGYINDTGTSSLAVSLEADKTLGSVVDTIRVGDSQSMFNSYSFGELNGEKTLMARVPLAVRAS